MTDSTSPSKAPQSRSLRVTWEQWLALNTVVTRSPPAGEAYRVTVVVTTGLPADHPLLSTLLAAERIVIEIDNFADGRVFGLARLLRDRLGFGGDLEVSGDFLPDQISFLQRCGVNAFSGEDLVRDALNYYSGFYQPPRAGIDEVTFIRGIRRDSETS